MNHLRNILMLAIGLLIVVILAGCREGNSSFHRLESESIYNNSRDAIQDRGTISAAATHDLEYYEIPGYEMSDNNLYYYVR